MNWKRGLTRLYVILWIGFATFGAYIAKVNSGNVLADRERVNTYRQAYPRLTIEALSDTLIARATQKYNENDHDVGDILLQVNNIIQSPEYERPFATHAKIWGIWLAVCGLAPALLLGITVWIIRGFEKQPNS